MVCVYVIVYHLQQAILEATMVTNLDTGEVIPLSAAEERIPQGHAWSPLSEHLLRRTKEMAEASVAKIL